MAGKAKVKILVVEDNPAVLQLLERGLEPCGEVQSASDGADALLRVVEAVPDLVVSDYNMPGLNGRQLFEKLRARDSTQALPFIFVASRAEIEERLRPFIEGVEDYIPKPFFLRDLTARVKKVSDRIHLEKLQTTARRPGVIDGLLEEMNLIDLFQTLEMGQKSCRLTMKNDTDGKCEIYFEGGQVYDATFGTITGDEAVYKIAKWAKGSFEIDFNAAPSPEKRTTQSTQGMLMEAMRLLDESERAGEGG